MTVRLSMAGLASAVAAGLVLVSSCTTPDAATNANLTVADVDDEVLTNADAYEDVWLTHGRTYAEQRFSPLSEINADNVQDLGLVWSFDTEMRRGHEATPIMVDGTLYTTTSWSVVYAVDARTGDLRWRWDPEVDPARGRLACCDVVNRGVAVYEGKV
ncbi:MAG: PQQ-binding-like beta-propeller repeat protein, partial [Longimicrobiales bacterium]|nr:PQQ-binding-like beta-propeller repeat protein [Longimicrobiales bacterium]